MVHRGMLPRPRRHLDDGEVRRSATNPTQGSGAAGGGGSQHKPRGTGGRQESGGHCSNAHNGGSQGHVATLPASGEKVVLGSEDVGDASEWKGGAVLDRLHTGEGPPSLQECRRLGPFAQLGPLHGPGLPTKCPPDRAQEIPGMEETVAGEAAGGTIEDGPTFCSSTESRTKGATARGETKRLDPGDDVETHRRESLRTPGPTIQAGIHTANWGGGK